MRGESHSNQIKWSKESFSERITVSIMNIGRKVFWQLHRYSKPIRHIAIGSWTRMTVAWWDIFHDVSIYGARLYEPIIAMHIDRQSLFWFLCISILFMLQSVPFRSVLFNSKTILWGIQHLISQSKLSLRRQKRNDGYTIRHLMKKSEDIFSNATM